MTKKRIEPFPEGKRDDTVHSGNPHFVKIYTDCDGTDESCNIEWIQLDRRLTEDEVKRLNQSKTPDEVRDLLYNVKNINDPTIYEIDFTTRV